MVYEVSVMQKTASTLQSALQGANFPCRVRAVIPLAGYYREVWRNPDTSLVPELLLTTQTFTQMAKHPSHSKAGRMHVILQSKDACWVPVCFSPEHLSNVAGTSRTGRSDCLPSFERALKRGGGGSKNLYLHSWSFWLNKNFKGRKYS